MSAFDSFVDGVKYYVDVMGNTFYGVDAVESGYDEDFSDEEQEDVAETVEDVATTVAGLFGYDDELSAMYDAANDLGDAFGGTTDESWPEGEWAGANLQRATAALRLDVARAVELDRGPWATIETSRRNGAAVLKEAETRRLLALGRALDVILKQE